MVRICGIDIGTVNFAFFIDEIENIDNIKNMSIDEIYTTGKRIRINVKNVTVNNEIWSDETRIALINHLNDNKDDFEKCDMICIEQQFFNSHNKFNIQSNIKALKICECVTTWFQIFLPNVNKCYIQPKLKYNHCKDKDKDTKK